jgi:hypothetical protein
MIINQDYLDKNYIGESIWGHDRSLVRHAFEDDAVIDTKEDITHGVDKTRPRKELEEKEEDGKTKVQIWVKKETLEYQKRLTLLQIELLKLTKSCKRKRFKSSDYF